VERLTGIGIEVHDLTNPSAESMISALHSSLQREQALTAEHDLAKVKYSEAEAQRRAAEAEREAAEVQLRAAEAQRSANERNRRKLEKKFKASERSRREADAKLSAIQSSTIWRVTGPLRWLIGRLNVFPSVYYLLEAINISHVYQKSTAKSKRKAPAESNEG